MGSHYPGEVLIAALWSRLWLPPGLLGVARYMHRRSNVLQCRASFSWQARLTWFWKLTQAAHIYQSGILHLRHVGWKFRQRVQRLVGDSLATCWMNLQRRDRSTVYWIQNSICVWNSGPHWAAYSTLCLKKRAPFYFYDNFVRCWPIFIILSLADSSGNLQ